MPDDFRASLITHVKAVIQRADRGQTEAAPQQYLILPFFRVLGYDSLNPDEVVPEPYTSFRGSKPSRFTFAPPSSPHSYG
jgi:hypothetical protein